MQSASGEHQRWVGADEAVKGAFPHIHTWLSDEDDFRRVLVKLLPDSTFLAVASGFGSDGGKVVCFGSGYGVIAALMGLDKSIQGGNWKVDIPWRDVAR